MYSLQLFFFIHYICLQKHLNVLCLKKCIIFTLSHKAVSNEEVTAINKKVLVVKAINYVTSLKDSDKYENTKS